MTWLDKAYPHLLNGDYVQVADLYETAIANNPTLSSHYWYLGLAYLLQKAEEQAQETWMTAMT